MLSYWCRLYPSLPQASSLVLLAGQIGLAPGSMVLAGSDQQAELALTHVASVLEACHTHLNSALLGLCYYTGEAAGWRARMAWQKVCATGFRRSDGKRPLTVGIGYCSDGKRPLTVGIGYCSDGKRPLTVGIGYCSDGKRPLTVGIGYCSDGKRPLTVGIGYCSDGKRPLTVAIGYCSDGKRPLTVAIY